MDPKECKPLFQKVLEFYRYLDLEVDDGIPYFLVDSTTMHELYPGEDVGTVVGCHVVINDSIRFERIEECLKRKGKIEVQKRMEVLKPELKHPKKRGFMAFERIKNCLKGTRIVKEAKKPLVVVLVLFGRLNVEMGATLAHEMMHSLLHLKRVTGSYVLEEDPLEETQQRVEEGVCQVLEYMWLKWFYSDGFDSSYITSSMEAEHMRDLKKLYAKPFETECCEINRYCQEFRDARKAVIKFGLTTILDHFVKEGSLPAC